MATEEANKYEDKLGLKPRLASLLCRSLLPETYGTAEPMCFMKAFLLTCSLVAQCHCGGGFLTVSPLDVLVCDTGSHRVVFLVSGQFGARGQGSGSHHGNCLGGGGFTAVHNFLQLIQLLLLFSS